MISAQEVGKSLDQADVLFALVCEVRKHEVVHKLESLQADSLNFVVVDISAWNQDLLDEERQNRLVDNINF